MSGGYSVTVETLGNLGDFSKLDAAVRTATLRGINRGAAWAMPEISRRVRRNINFTAGYINQKLRIKRLATSESFEAVISGPRRATSLARFLVGSTAIGGARKKSSVSVMIKPGQTRILQRAFLVRLKAGSQLTDTIFNLGLAIRLRSGQVPRMSEAAKLIGKSTWLLYGPSVDQALINNAGGGEAKDMTPDIQDVVETEFNRQLDFLGFKR